MDLVRWSLGPWGRPKKRQPGPAEPAEDACQQQEERLVSEPLAPPVASGSGNHSQEIILLPNPACFTEGVGIPLTTAVWSGPTSVRAVHGACWVPVVYWAACSGLRGEGGGGVLLLAL